MTVLLGYAQKSKNFVFGAISFPPVFVLETTLFLDKKVTCATFLGLNFFFVFSYLFVFVSFRSRISEKASSRRAIFVTDRPSVVEGNFAPSFYSFSGHSCIIHDQAQLRNHSDLAITGKIGIIGQIFSACGTLV